MSGFVWPGRESAIINIFIARCEIQSVVNNMPENETRESTIIKNEMLGIIETIDNLIKDLEK